MPIYKYEGKKYNIPEDKVAEFERAFPNATVVMYAGDKTYNIPVSKQQAFKTSFDDASYNPIQAAADVEGVKTTENGSVVVSPEEGNEANYTFGDMLKDTRDFISPKKKKRRTLADTLNASVPGVVNAEYTEAVNEGIEREVPLTQEEKDQRAAMRQRLQEDGTIDRMKESRKEARREKLRAFGSMLGSTPQVTSFGVSTNVFDSTDEQLADVGQALDAGTEYRQSKLLQEKLDVALDMARAGENQDGLRGVENLGLGLWDSATRLSTWDFGASDIVNNLTLQQIVEKWENDPSSLTATEQKVLEGIGMATAVQELYSDQVGIGYNVGQSLPESAGFMASMALNPASGLGKSLARNAVRTYGRNSIAKSLARIGGDIAETAIMTATTGAGRVAADALERINGSSTYEIGENGVIMYGGQKDQETVGDAVLKAIGSNFIENYSEALGEYFDPLLGMSRKVAAGGLRKMHLDKWADALSDVQPSQMTASIRALREKTKFGGIFGEVMEEEIGMALNTLFVGDNQWSDFVDLETQLTTVLSCAIMSGTLNGVEQVSSVAARRGMEKNAKNAEQEALYRFGSKKFDPLREAIDQASPEGMVDVLRDVYMSQEYTVGQKRALAEYAAARLQLQYYNAADAKARRQVNKTQQELLDAQEAGLNAQLPQLFNIARAAQFAEDELLDYDGDYNLVDIIRSSMNRPEEMERILGDLPPREAQLVTNYIYSRARMEGAYQGRSNRAEDYIDDFAYSLEPAVVTDAEGNRTITTAIMGDRSVYVLENNGDLAHIMRPDGSKTLIKTSELTNITTSSAEEVIDRYRDMYISEYNAETENAFEHHPKTQAPQVGLQLQSPEGEVVITAVNDNMVEIVPAVYKDGQVQPKEGAEPKTITVDDAYAWQDDYYLSMDADQAYANAMAEASNVSAETTENPSFEQGDELTFYVNGEPINAEITGITPEGKYLVQIDHLVDGLSKSVVDEYTADELSKLSAPSNNMSAETAENESTPSEQIEQSVSEEVTNGQNAETQPTETEGVAPVAPAAPQTARERVPKDKKGNPIYEQTDADTAWDAIVEETEGDTEMAQRVAEQMLANKRAALEKLQKGKAKAGANVAQIIANEKKHQEAIAKAEADVKAWERIAQANIIRQQKAELERAAAEKAEAEQKRAEEARILAEQEEQARIEREQLNGVPDMVDDVPADARARGFRRVNGHKVDRQEIVPSLQGKEVGVKFANDMIANGRVAVIEAEQLQPSHLQGQRNPAHFIDEAQPKERNDEASIASARRIASNIRPEEITTSVTAYTGAPTVNMRGEAIQGNSRSDALRVMWAEHPDQAEKYKQYLIDHAEEFGLNAEEVSAMQHPVLVNMLDVSDADAINLGQYVAQDTESGGTERIKPKNVARKMGSDIRSYANILLRSSDEEASFSELVDKNGVEVLKWMNTKGYITPTQYASAFDSKGNMTAEAKNDLRGVLYQSIFQGGNTQLEEQFNAMPAKAQKAILATAYRDYDSPESERMIAEIQSSIRAYYALSHDRAFVDARNYVEAKEAMLVWSRQYQMDDVTGESFLPSENFSNFALELAVRYKGNTQSATQNLFNELFDLIQGTKEASLFEEADNRPRTLAEAIKETLNIDYNGQNGSNALVGDDTSSQEGRQGSTGDSTSGELPQNDESAADDRGRVAGDSNTGAEEARGADTAPVAESSDEYILNEGEKTSIDQSTLSQLKNFQRTLQGNLFLIEQIEKSGELTEELAARKKKDTAWLKAVKDSIARKEQIKARNKWNVKSGNHPVPLGTVKKMFAEWNENADIQALFDRVFDTFSKLGVNVTFEDNIGSGTTQGWFSIGENRVKLPMHMVYSNRLDNQQKASVMVHEMIHGVTKYVLWSAKLSENGRNKLGINLSQEMITAAEQLNEIYGIIKKDKRFKGQYGLTSVDEMVSELSEPKFRALLKETTVWDKIVEAIRNILGLNAENNALDAASRALDYIIDNYDADLYRKVSSLGKKKATVNIFDLAEDVLAERELQAKPMVISKADDNLRFREKEEPKELIAVHNISEGNLKKVLEAGSLIMPSIAITKADMGHDSFGEISLLFDKSTINPSDRRNKVYGGDAWTPRFPEVRVKIDSDVVNRVREVIYDAIKDERLRSAYSISAELHPSNVEDAISKYGIDSYYRQEWMKLAYLLVNGKRVKMPMRKKSYGYGTEKIYELIKERGLSVRDIYNDSESFYDNNPDFVAGVKEIVNEAKLANVPAEQRDELKATLEAKPFRFMLFDLYIGQALQMEDDIKSGAPKEFLDKQALRDLVEKKVKTDNADYNKWVDNLFEGIVEKRGIRNNRDWYTPSGNQRSWEQLYDPATPANILKHMLAVNEQGGSGGLFDSNIMGASAETYESIEEIREKGKQRLKKLPYEEYDEWSESVGDRMSDIVDDFLTDRDKSVFGSSIDAKIEITKAVAKDKTANGIYKHMKREYPNFTMEHAKQVEEIVKEIQEFATGYFEAKPQRLVSVNEVMAAVVPSNASKEIVDALKSNGIEVVTYKKGDEEARKRVVKRVSSSMGIRFRDGGRFFQGLSNDEIFEALNEHTQYYSGGPSRLMQALEEYYKGEIVSASHNAGIAMSEGLVPVPDKKYAGIEEEYHHIEFRGEDGETFVEAVPFVKAEDVEKIYGIQFREGEGAVSDREVSYENDPIAKFQGKPRYYGKKAAAFAERERRRMENAAKEAAEMLGIEAEIVTDASMLQGRKAKAKGWYDIINKKVVVVVPNHVSMGDAVRTVLHEGVAHHGLRELFGAGFDAMLDNIYNNVAPELKARIDAIAERTGVNTQVATEEYLASLAETTNFEEAQRRGWWQQIKRFFVDMLNKLAMPGLNLKEELTDNELRYLLWRSYKNLVEPNSYLRPLGYAEDMVKQKELKVGEYAEKAPATPMAAEMSEAEESEAEKWAAITMQRIEELEAQMEQLDNEIVEMEADRDADDESRYDMWEEQLDVLDKQRQEIYDELEGLYSLKADEEDIEDYEAEREEGKQRQLYQKRIDNAYLKAVREGDWEEATDLFRQYVLSKAEDEGIVPMDYGVGYRGGAHSSIAKKVKEENPDAIAEAAYQMSIRIPKGSILVPMPSRTGNATYTVKLAEAIAKATDSEVRDVLKGKARMSVYEAKQKGIKMTPEDLGMYTTEELPKGKNIVIIDNVIDKGTTALAAVSAVKGASVVAYAYTLGDKQRVATLKLAEPVTYDDNKRIIPLSQRFNKETDDIRYRLVDDPAEIERLENEPTIKAYRAMQVINGELYPPMSAVVDGKLREPIALGQWEQSEERPELADDNGRFKLDKGNKKSLKAAYNPYFHSSSTPLNDQFSEAQDRDNLVTVEVEVPVSEADGTSGYKAEKAKDAVGTHQWKAGIIQGQLTGTREVFLTRWDKPVRIVPDSEVAGVIAKMLEGTGIVMPSNVVTPSLRAELEKLGVPFVETTNRGKLAEGEHKGEGYGKVYGKKSTKKSKKKAEIIAEVERESTALGVPVRIARSVDEIPDADTRKRAVDGQLKGYFDPRTGEVVLYEPNTDDANDAKRTVLHEIVGHKGLRQLIGKDNFNKMMIEVYYMLPERTRQSLNPWMERNGWSIPVAMDEYLSEKAEEGGNITLWQKAVSAVMRWLRKRGVNVKLTESDIKYLLWRSRKNLSADTVYDMATDVILKREAVSSDPYDGIRYRDTSKRISDMANEEYEKAVMSTGAAGPIRGLMYAFGNIGKGGFKAWKNDMAEAFVDYSRSIAEAQKAIEKALGRKIRGYEDVHSALNALSSKNQRELFQLQDRILQPLSDAIARLTSKANKTYDEFERYLEAKHGLERNIKYAERDAEEEAEKQRLQVVESANNLAEEDRKSVHSAVGGHMAYHNGKLQSKEYTQEQYNKEVAKLNEWRDKQLAHIEEKLQEAIAKAETDKATKKAELFEKNRKEDYSGLTEMFTREGEKKLSLTELEKRAKEYVDEFESACDKQQLDETWKRIRLATMFSLEKSYNTGLISKEQRDAVDNMFEYYVPLRGWKNDYTGDVYSYIATGNPEAVQSTIKYAKGRKSEAANIIGTIFTMANSAIVMGNKNDVNQRLLNLAYNDPSGLLNVEEMWYEETASGELIPLFPDMSNENLSQAQKVKMVEDYKVKLQKLREEGKAKLIKNKFKHGYPLKAKNWQEQQHAVVVKRGGEEYIVWVNGNPKIAQALNGLLHKSQREEEDNMASNILRWMAATQTSYSPEFVFTNFQRDLLTASAGNFIKFGAGFEKEFAKALWEVRPFKNLTKKDDGVGIYNLFRLDAEGKLDMNNPIHKMFREFLDNGGVTGISTMLDPVNYEKRVLREIEKSNVDLKGIPQTVAENVAGAVEFANRGIENATRFATYMASRRLGKSVTESVRNAKDVSVNFNMKGSGAWGNAFLRKYFIYANAAIQGLRTVYSWNEASKSRFYGLGAGILATSVLMAFLNDNLNEWMKALFGGDDDDEDNAYYGLSEWNRYNFFNINIPYTDTFVHWSLPQEFRPIYAIGQISYDLMTGRITTERALKSMAVQLNNLSPLSLVEDNRFVKPDDTFLDAVIKGVVPSQIRPMFEAYIWNEDFLGRKIHYQADYNRDLPEWKRAGKNTPEFMIGASRYLSEISGGEENKRGLLDNKYLTNPSINWYFLKAAGGGTATFIGKIINTTEHIIKSASEEDYKETLDWNEIPVLPKIIASAGDDYSKQRLVLDKYYRYRSEFESIEKELSRNKNDKDMSQDRKRERQAELKDEKGYEYYEILRRYESEYDSIRKKIKQYEEVGDVEEEKYWKDKLFEHQKKVVEKVGSN